MRYLVISDTHGRDAHIRQWALAHRPMWDAVIHAGDFFRDGVRLAQALDLPLYGAQGNNDLDPAAPWERCWTDGKWRVGVVHGHQWPAPSRSQGLDHWARERGLDVVVYGHSHVPEAMLDAGVWRINPGAIHAPRQGSGRSALTLNLSEALTFRFDHPAESAPAT